MLTPQNAVKEKFGRDPARGASISRVVAPLRVATPRYTKAQRILCSRRVSKPEGCHHAIVGCLPLRPMGCLLRRTSENSLLLKPYEKVSSAGKAPHHEATHGS